MKQTQIAFTREGAKCLCGVLMVLAEARDELLIERLGMTGLQLDELAEKFLDAPSQRDGGTTLTLTPEQQRVAAGAFDACFDLMPSGMTMSLIGRERAELRSAQAEVARALEAAGYTA